MKRIPSIVKGSCKHLFMELDDNDLLDAYFCNNDDASVESCINEGKCPMVFDELYGEHISVKRR